MLASISSTSRRIIINLIGLNGLKRSGKDTTAGFIKEIMTPEGDVVKSRAFAYKLKIMAAKALGFDRPDDELVALMDEAKERWIFHITKNIVPLEENWMDQTLMAQGFHVLTGREYLQHFGNKAREVFGDTFWIDQVLPNPFMQDGWGGPGASLEMRYPNVDTLVVTDVRYPNEAERVKRLGGVVFEVIRPGLASDGHDSEKKLPAHLIDWEVHNAGDLSDLRDAVEQAMTHTVYA